ncbi:MAG: peptidylprolyl isomerase [Pedobacter sp.]|nr:MAG: peptidylprolyl isomerase [Pedobacter sp.]
MNRLFTIILCIVFSTSLAAKPKNKYVRIKTEMGECIIKLYNETPLHRDNFVKLAKSHTLDGRLFHRIIKAFMIQGGEKDLKGASAADSSAYEAESYTVPAEFRDSLFHKKGVLAAARDNNPEKASSGTQFYIVQGKVFTDEQLDAVERDRLKFKLPLWQREVYKTLGGSPHLDKNYTVYGEVVQGLELVDKIAEVKTGERDRPVSDLKMTVTLLKNREIRKLEKSLKKSK